jgi:hypothetical protein
MPIIKNEMIIQQSVKNTFEKMYDISFEEYINPNNSFEILYKSERIIRYRWKNELDSPGFEKMIIPETLTVITKRNQKTPFIYSLFIYIFASYNDVCRITYIQDFELDEDNKNKENGVMKYLTESYNITAIKMLEYFQ